MGIGLFGQATPVINGSFFFEEQGRQALAGSPFRTVGLLQLDGRGLVSGTHFVRQANLLTTRTVRGEYQIAADGAGQMTLRFDSIDEGGNVQTASNSYRVLRTASGAMNLLRADEDVLANGKLTPSTSATPNLAGSYVVSEEIQGVQPLVSLSAWTIQANGNVTASVLARGFYQVKETTLTGRLEPQADGSLNVRLASAPLTGDDGESFAQTVVNYKLVPAGSDFRLLRMDEGLLAETEVSKK